MTLAPIDFGPLEKIANAVLYEGFLLYPYRKSSLKNQRRWHFGTIEPKGEMQTECLVEAERESDMETKVRFLQEETEREVHLSGQGRQGFQFGPLSGSVEVESTPMAGGVVRVTVRIENASAECAMLSTHTLLGTHYGSFVSLIDPPEKYRAAAAQCRNVGTWPVLAGSEGQRSLMLSSPVILYDYPQIAPESATNLFDGTEIDEILSLRILTLSEEERAEVRAAGGHGAEILSRTELLPPEALAKMHGAIRNLRAATTNGFRAGDRVRLCPRKRADIFDIALNGKTAIVEAVECDFENKIHLAVTLADDPGRDLGRAGYLGHRFFFTPDEVELL